MICTDLTETIGNSLHIVIDRQDYITLIKFSLFLTLLMLVKTPDLTVMEICTSKANKTRAVNSLFMTFLHHVQD